MNPRTVAALQSSGHTPAQAAMLSDAELLRVPGIGHKAIRELREAFEHPAVTALRTLNVYAASTPCSLSQDEIVAMLQPLVDALPAHRTDHLLDSLLSFWGEQ